MHSRGIIARVAGASPATSYTTTFTRGNENPLSEGGKWINGKTDGIVWNDFKLDTNRACAAAASSDGPNPPGHFDDAISILHPSVYTPTSNCNVIITVFRAGGYSPPGTHELGVFLRFNLSANSAFGYEAYLNHAGNHTIVRWNGPLDDFTPLAGISVAPVATGDRIKLEAIGSTLNYYVDRGSGFVLENTATDSTYTTGQPGMQSYVMTTSTATSYCVETFEANNI